MLAKDPSYDEAQVAAAIVAMNDDDRVMAERLHAVIITAAPTLSPKTWYGMPAYAKDGKIVLFFRDKKKFKERYLTLGFNDCAALDDGDMWPITFAIIELTPDVETNIAELVQKAVN
jgi:uncharacterized protein YdhG (YjbR/CyaY superfamily)